MMADYIDRQAALDALSAHKEVLLYIMDKCGVTEEVNKTLEIICNVPSANAVEVVRCKDCIMHGVCRFERGLGLDGFCSQGRRKDG